MTGDIQGPRHGKCDDRESGDVCKISGCYV